MHSRKVNELIPWHDWVKSENIYYVNAEATQLACPKCGKRIYRKTDLILACYPPKHKYFCGSCDWVGYA